MGRKPGWSSGPTEAIRVPAALVEQIRAYAVALDSVTASESPIPCEIPEPLEAALAALVEKYRPQGREADARAIAYPPIGARLYESVVGRQYGNIQFQLTGHLTNPGCIGIFGHLHPEDRELVLWMLLAELLEGTRRPFGGSVHLVKAACPKTAKQSA